MRTKVEPTPSVTHEDSEVCDECGSKEIQDHSREVVCENCGLVLEENNIDHGPEWRAFNSQEQDEKSRVGSPITATMHDRGLTTVIGDDDNGMSQRKKKRMKRIRTWDTRSKQTSKERGLKFSLGEIERLVSELGLPNAVHEMAAIVFREAHNEEIIKGRSYEGMSSAAVYVACRQQSMSRTFDEIEEYARVERQKIYDSYMKLQSELDLEIGPVDPNEYVSRFVTMVREARKEEGEAPNHKTFTEIQKCVHEIVDKTVDEGLHSGHDPATVVASAIYLAQRKMNVGMTQSEVAQPCGLTQVAIRGMFKKQADLMNIDISSSNRSTTYEIKGFGEVKNKKSRELAKALLERFHPEEVEHRGKVNGHTVDFIVDDTYALDISSDETTAATVKSTSYTYILFEDDLPADYNVPWKKMDNVARRLSDL